MKRAAAIRHVAFEDADGFAAPLRAAGYAVDYVDPTDGIGTNVDEADLVIVLGGPIGAGEDDIYPFLEPELALIERRLADRRPLMGVCLGAQLIARAAGARVYPMPVKEIGFAPIALTAAGEASCLAPFADEPLALHWHGDAFDLPPGATRLASTALCENQAFALGPEVIGFQFHPEATGRHIERWLVGHAVELAAAGADVTKLRADARRSRAALERKSRDVAAAWLARLGA